MHFGCDHLSAMSLGQRQHGTTQAISMWYMIMMMMMIHSFSQMKRRHSPKRYRRLTVLKFQLKNKFVFIYEMKKPQHGHRHGLGTKVKD